MGHFGGYVWLFLGCGGGPEGPGKGNYPSQMWMSLYDKKKFGWLHDTMIGKMGHFEGYVWLFWGCGGGPEGPG